MIGGIVGNYRLTAQLARGAVGVVYQAEHLREARTVAVRALPLAELSLSAQVRLKARLRREAFIQAQLDHPHIVHSYEFIATAERFFLVVEFVAGQNLRELLLRQGAPTVAQAVNLCRQALDALGYAHRCKIIDESDLQHTGILHRDLRPANLLLDPKGRLKIADFALARILSEQAGWPPSPEASGYWSPEQRRGQALDARADLYSLGAILHELLTGAPPAYPAHSNKHEMEATPAQRELPLELHPALAAILDRALRAQPSERYQSADEFDHALQDYERRAGLQAARPANAASAAPAAADHQPWLPGLTVAPESGAYPATAPALAPAPAGVSATDEPARPSVFAPTPLPARRPHSFAVAAVMGLLLVAVLASYLLTRSNTQPDSASGLTRGASAIEAATIDVNRPLMADASGTPQTAYQRAQALIRRDQYEAAVEVYQEYLALNPMASDADQVNAQIASVKQAQTHLADAEAALASGQLKLARFHFTRAGRLQPNSQRARDGLSEIDAKLGQPAAAPEESVSKVVGQPAGQSDAEPSPDLQPATQPLLTTPSTEEPTAAPRSSGEAPATEEQTAPSATQPSATGAANPAPTEPASPAPAEAAPARRVNNRRRSAKPAKPVKSDAAPDAAPRAN